MLTLRKLLLLIAVLPSIAWEYRKESYIRDIISESYGEIPAILSDDQLQIETSGNPHLTINLHCVSDKKEEFFKNCMRKLFDLDAGSLKIIINFPNLFRLFMFESAVKSGSLTTAFENILMSKELRYEAALRNSHMSLNISYNKEEFDLLVKYFINRDGGGLAVSGIEKHITEDAHYEIEDDIEHTIEEVETMTEKEFHDLILAKQVETEIML
ncbi:uncharacterized protein LOC144361785 [Saccoglossus kowalevskii]